MADERDDSRLSETPEFKAWVRKQSGLGQWLVRKRAEFTRADEEVNATYLRTVVANQRTLKEENYLWSCSIVRPQAWYRGRFPHMAHIKAQGMYMNPYEIRLKELKGELIRWNMWHSWDLNPTEDPRDTSKYPKPSKYDPLNPPRPNIRAKRLARQASAQE